jgi:hypothetical protein
VFPVSRRRKVILGEIFGVAVVFIVGWVGDIQGWSLGIWLSVGVVAAVMLPPLLVGPDKS